MVFMAAALALGAPIGVARAAGAAPRYPLELGGAGARSLVDQNGQPFLLWGEAAWSLIAQPTLADADRYLDDRQQKRVDAVLVNLIEHKFAAHAPADANGNAPFTGRPFATPNPAYFADADQVINAAAARGIVVLLAPLYLGYQCSDEGWCAEVEAATSSELLAWGQFLGKRYASFDNIVWVIGGDTDPTPVADKVRQVVDGILDFDTRHLMTAHNQQESQAVTPWPNEAWLNVNDFYTYDDTLYVEASNAYQRSPVMPFFLIESIYENEHDSTTSSVRAQAYWTMLSGAMGQVFGNCPLWNFGVPSPFCTSTDWAAQLGSPGSLSMSYAQALLTSRPWSTLVPDTAHAAIVDGFGTYGDPAYVTAARASDGATVIAYLAASRTITVDLASVSGTQARAWWYDPTEGAATAVGTFTTAGQKSFSPPAPTGDWVFVLDDASRGYAAPGAAASSTAVPAVPRGALALAGAALLGAACAVLGRRRSRR